MPTSTRSRVDPSPIQIERWPWEKVCTYFAETHKLGEHVSIEGPTGSGKSTLTRALMVERGMRRAKDGRPTRIVGLVTKRRDSTMSALLTIGWKRITKLEDWPPAYGEEHTLAWPPPGDLRNRGVRQAPFFEGILSEVEESGNQIVWINEAATFSLARPEGFGFRSYLNVYWKDERSNHVSLVAETQRPCDVPRPMWSEPWWLFLFRPEDEDDLKRVAELSGNKRMVLEVLPQLDTHEFLMMRRRPERLAAISQVEIAPR